MLLVLEAKQGMIEGRLLLSIPTSIFLGSSQVFLSNLNWGPNWVNAMGLDSYLLDYYAVHVNKKIATKARVYW